MTPLEVGRLHDALIESALHYARRGWSVFPVNSIVAGRCSCGRRDCDNIAKHPRTKNGLHDATLDADTIEAWWAATPDANLAVRTGRESFWALDVDPDKGGATSLAALVARHGALPETVEQLTGGGGRHVLFAPPSSSARIPNSTSTLGPGLDVRGDGGYVIVPPSRHRSGRLYEWEAAHHPDETPLAQAPAWLLQRVLAPPAATNGNGQQRLSEDWAALLRGVEKGQRHQRLTQIVGHWLGVNVPAAEVETLGLIFAAVCRPPLDAADVRRVVHDLRAKDSARGAPSSEDGPVLVQLSTVAPEPVDWFWPGRIAFGKLALLIGNPGDGKSYLTDDMSARTSRALAWPTMTARAPERSVVMLSAEDGMADTIRPRVERQGGDAGRVHVLTAVKRKGADVPFSLETDLPALESAVAQTGAGLVTIDPVSAYLGQRDSFRDAEVRGVLAPLAALAERHRVAVVGVMHLTKDQQRRLLHRTAGSIGFVAAARTVFAVGRDPEDETGARRLVVCVKNNLTQFPPPLAFRISDSGLTWETEPVRSAADPESLLGTTLMPESSESRADLADAQRFLESLLAEGPVASAEVLRHAKDNGIAERTLWRAKRALKVDTMRPTGSKGWVWFRP